MTVLDKDGTIKQVNKVAMDTYGENIVGEKCYCVYKGRESDLWKADERGIAVALRTHIQGVSSYRFWS
jgi:hypothetical protein